MSETYAEIQEQADSWAATFPTVLAQWGEFGARVLVESDTHFLFIGSGTSLYISQAAARTFQGITGCVSTAAASSDIFLSSVTTVPIGFPVIAFVTSRSGATTEAVLAARHLVDNCPNVTVVAVTCGLGTELANTAHHALTLAHGAERSVVMTKSFTTMLLALQIVAGLLAKDERFARELQQLPGLLRERMVAFEDFASLVARPLDQEQFIYLGLGPNAGLAEEGALKLKEMTQTPCEAYNPLEFRHGPVSIVRRGTSVVILEALSEQAYVTDLESDLKGHGALVSVVGPYSSSIADLAVDLPVWLSDIARCLLYVPPLQLIAYRRALAQALDPDRPRNLSQVVTLKR